MEFLNKTESENLVDIVGILEEDIKIGEEICEEDGKEIIYGEISVLVFQDTKANHFKFKLFYPKKQLNSKKLSKEFLNLIDYKKKFLSGSRVHIQGNLKENIASGLLYIYFLKMEEADSVLLPHALFILKRVKLKKVTPGSIIVEKKTNQKYFPIENLRIYTKTKMNTRIVEQYREEKELFLEGKIFQEIKKKEIQTFSGESFYKEEPAEMILALTDGYWD